MKYYLTSDVHGFYSLLHSRLEDAGYFTDPEPHKLLILGDLFDRGKEAREMQRFLLDELKADRVILIRGNHEDLFQELIYEDGGYPRSYQRQNGTYDTALALTGMRRREAFLGVSRSGYRAFLCRRASNSQQRKDRLKDRILEIWHDSHQNYGAPKITVELRRDGEIISERTVGKYMKELGMGGSASEAGFGKNMLDPIILAT